MMPAAGLIESDTREIDTVDANPTNEDDSGNYWRVGYNGVSRIEAYTENGPCGPIPYYQIVKGSEVTARIPAHMAVISYRTKRKETE